MLNQNSPITVPKVSSELIQIIFQKILKKVLSNHGQMPVGIAT